MNKCTEINAGWPNEPGDVSPDAYDAFLTHVAHCPFHAKTLQAEAENTRAKFRRARGLNTHGRILTGAELRKAVRDYDRQHELWREIIDDSILPFRRIYLGNRGEDIAGSGKFFDFRNYEGDHQLDPDAGLQILGVVGEGKQTLELLLGWYPLCGVEHTGEEQFLELENGYTIGLRVNQLADREFNIGFRCVENAVRESERMGIIVPYHHRGAVNHSSSMLLWAATEKVQAWLRSLRTVNLRRLVSVFRYEPATTMDKLIWCFSCLLAFFIGFTALFWLENPSSSIFATGSEAKAPVTTTEQKPEKPRRRGKGSAAHAQTQTVPTSQRNQKGPAGGPTPETTQVTGVESDAPPNNKPTVPESKPNTNAEEVNIGPAAWYFQSLPPEGADGSIAIHTGYDTDLIKKLTAEMRKQDIAISPLTGSSMADHHVAVSWKIIREQTAVTVEATLTAGGDRKLLYARGDGSCPEQACDQAVRSVVSKVFAAMKDLSHNESTSSDF